MWRTRERTMGLRETQAPPAEPESLGGTLGTGTKPRGLRLQNDLGCLWTKPIRCILHGAVDSCVQERDTRKAQLSELLFEVDSKRQISPEFESKRGFSVCFVVRLHVFGKRTRRCQPAAIRACPHCSCSADRVEKPRARGSFVFCGRTKHPARNAPKIMRVS